jgi:hypothetical protein
MNDSVATKIRHHYYDCGRWENIFYIKFYLFIYLLFCFSSCELSDVLSDLVFWKCTELIF